MKNIKVLGLAIVASIVAAPAFAGETYVRNEWSNTRSYTDTNLHVKNATLSARDEWYGSYATKLYVEDNRPNGGYIYSHSQPAAFVSATKDTKNKPIESDSPVVSRDEKRALKKLASSNSGGGDNGSTPTTGNHDLNIKPTEVGGNGYAVHNSGSLLFGKYREVNASFVHGNINTWTNTYSKYHETSAGVR